MSNRSLADQVDQIQRYPAAHYISAEGYQYLLPLPTRLLPSCDKFPEFLRRPLGSFRLTGIRYGFQLQLALSLAYGEYADPISVGFGCRLSLSGQGQAHFAFSLQ